MTEDWRSINIKIKQNCVYEYALAVHIDVLTQCLTGMADSCSVQ